MFYTVSYSLALLICLIFSIFKRKNKMGIFLLSIYLFVSIFAIVLQAKQIGASEIAYDKISLFPFIFLLICYFLCFSPFLKNHNSFTSTKIVGYKNNGLLKLFLYFYFSCSVIRLLLETPNVLNLIRSGDWMQTYATGSNIVYSTPIGQLIMMFVSYFRLIALILAFALFVETNGKNNMDHIVSFLTIVFALVTGVFGALSSASRSLLFETIIIFFALLVFFFNRFTKRQKVFVFIVGSVALIGILFLMFKISDDRFGTRGTEDSLVFYLGQAPISFNSQMFFNIRSYMFGEYAFGGFFGNNSFDPAIIGGEWGTMFYTFVGYLYIDWGPVGTLFICIILFLCFKNIIKKNSFRLSDIFLIFLFYQFLLNGVFVIGRNYSVSLLINIIIYIVVKIFDNDYLPKQKGCKQIAL